MDFVEHFADREEAAELLSKKLANCDVVKPLILGLAQGGVQMAKLVADHLGAAADIVLVKRVGHPANHEYTVGYVTEEGQILLTSGAKESGVKLEDLRPSALQAIQDIESERRRLTPDREAVQVSGREVIIVHDGISTGEAMRAAIQSARSGGASRIVVASPVASRQAIENLIDEGVEIVLLAMPAVFSTVSQFYGSYPILEDADVASILSHTRSFLPLQ